jgi:GT2 family glycosyltransferase
MIPELAPVLTGRGEEASAGRRPRASIIIVNHNGRTTIAACLESILAALNGAAEVIVVDNGSSDGSAELVAASFPTVTLLHAGNLGFGGGNNLGAAQARGEFLVFVNPDTTVTPGWWEALVAALTEDGAGMVTSRILLAGDPQRLNTAGNTVHLSGLTLCRGMGRPAARFDQPAAVGAVSGAAFAMRGKLFQELGGFDAGYFMYMEETDLSWRAQLAGYPCRYAPQSIIHHHYQLRFGPDKTFYQERNRYRMLLKTLRWRTLLLLSPALLLAEVVTWGFVVTRDRRNWRGKLRAYRSVFAEWPEIRWLRREVQRRRVAPDRRLLEQMTGRLDFAQTGDGRAAKWAEAVFNPLFDTWRWVMLKGMRW